MSDFSTEIKAIIVAIIIIVVFCLATCKLFIYHDNKLWNDGHCNVCGGNWVYEQAVGHRSSTSYIYICDGCGKRIEIYEVR